MSKAGGVRKRLPAVFGITLLVVVVAIVALFVYDAKFKPLDAPACKLFSAQDYKHIIGTEATQSSPDDSTGAECDYSPVHRDTYNLAIILACGVDAQDQWQNFSTAPGVANSGVSNAKQNIAGSDTQNLSSAIYVHGVYIEVDYGLPGTPNFSTLNEVLQVAIKKDVKGHTREDAEQYWCPKIPKE